MKFKSTLVLSLFALLSFSTISAQQDDPILPYKVAPQNLLKFNRFLINPTFSTVREDKSYINFLHRNQSVQFEDNDQTYFVSYSGRISDRTGLGLSLYNQNIGPVSNTGVLANLGYGVRLSENSVFSFGTNLAYYVSGLNRNRVDVIDPNDFRLQGTQNSNILSIQPGFNLAVGDFDFGVFAENLFDYNFSSNSTLIDNFGDKTYSGHLQYTHQFQNGSGLMQEARLMPLARVRLNDQRIANANNGQDLSYGGSLILDLPKLGWLQGGYDSFYGASAGVGFNINKRLSLGYTMEKGFTTDFNNLGITHEINFAYSFTPNLTEDRVMLEKDNELVNNNKDNPFDEEALVNNSDLEELKRKLAENDAIIEELMYRQDSLEVNHQKDMEQRFEMVMRMVRSQTNGERPDIEKRAGEMFLGKDSQPSLALNNPSNDGPAAYQNNGTLQNTPSTSTSTQPNTAQIAGVPTDRYTKTTDTSYSAAEQNQVNGSDERYSSSTAATVQPISTTQVATVPINRETRNVETSHPAVERNQVTGSKESYSTTTGTTVQPLSTQVATTPTRKETKNAETSYPIAERDQTKAPVSYATEREKTIPYKGRVFNDFQDVTDGFYVIANSFKSHSAVDRYIETLNKKGIGASYITNPNNDINYVYLKRFNSEEDAQAAITNNLDGRYDGKMWVMNVDSSYLNGAYANYMNTVKRKKTGALGTASTLGNKPMAKDQLATSATKERIYRIDGINEGFYIIANVFASQKNANRFVELLNSQGLSASYFINPENNWRYVYIKKHDSWSNALISYYSKINDMYTDKMWIMRVVPTNMT